MLLILTLTYAVDSGVYVRRKVAFLLNNLLVPQEGEDPSQNTTTSDVTKEALLANRTINIIVSSLLGPTPTGPNGDRVEVDEQTVENMARVLRATGAHS